MASYDININKYTSPDIIKINSNDKFVTNYSIRSGLYSVKWVNLNVKHHQKYYNTGIWERNASVLDKQGQDIYFTLTNSTSGGVGSSSDPYKFNAFYDGGIFNVSFSANDEVTRCCRKTKPYDEC